MRLTIKVELEFDGPDIVASLRDADGCGGGAAFRIPLHRNRIERELSDIALLLASASGTLPAKLREHFTEHFAPGAPIGHTCQFCKLQGRVLAAEGHRRLRDDEHSRRAIPAQGQSEVRHIALGHTSLGAARADRDRADRAAERAARLAKNLPKLPKLGQGDTTDVVF